MLEFYVYKMPEALPGVSAGRLPGRKSTSQAEEDVKEQVEVFDFPKEAATRRARSCGDDTGNQSQTGCAVPRHDLDCSQSMGESGEEDQGSSTTEELQQQWGDLRKVERKSECIREEVA